MVFLLVSEFYSYYVYLQTHTWEFMMSIVRAVTAAFTLMAVASTAGAATVSINAESFGAGAASAAAARAAQTAFHSGAVRSTTEDFEGFAVSGSPASFTAPTIETAVGDFTSIAPARASGAPLSPAAQLHVRDGSGNTSNRFNTTLGGSNYLDSNDNNGILWTVPGSASLGAFDRISFLATDIDDVGNVQFSLTAGGDVLDTIFNPPAPSATVKNALGDGELLLFTLLFGEQVSDLTVEMIGGVGDGFALDDVTVSAVPLPAAAWMLLAGVGALAGIGRARRAA